MELGQRVPEEVTAVARHLIGLRPDVDIVVVDGAVELRHGLGCWRVRGLGKAAGPALKALVTEPMSAVGTDEPRLRRALAGLPVVVSHTVAGEDGGVLAAFVPITRAARPLEARTTAPDAPARLSRFGYLRRLPSGGGTPGGGADTGTGPVSAGTGDVFVLESPLSAFRVELHSPDAVALIASLAAGRTAAEAAGHTRLPADQAELLVALLRGAALLDDADTGAGDPAREVVLPLWEFHDLLFHTRSRYGLHDYAGGGIYAHAERRPPFPALPPTPSPLGRNVELPVPAWQDVVTADRTFTEVLEDRRSVRAYDPAAPLTLDQLGELLYRAARVRGVADRVDDDPTSYELVDQPYPTGGGTGELDIHLTVARCEGLEPGIYHYDRAAHRLVLHSADARARTEMLAHACLSTGGALADPQVVLSVTSRIGRLSWKYSAIAYAVTLKHVGVLYQTLYLVATAMGLSPCGLGSGNSEVIARNLGLDWVEQPAVGEFALGGRPAGDRAPVTGFSDVASQAREVT